MADALDLGSSVLTWGSSPLPAPKHNWRKIGEANFSYLKGVEINENIHYNPINYTSIFNIQLYSNKQGLYKQTYLKVLNFQ